MPKQEFVDVGGATKVPLPDPANMTPMQSGDSGYPKIIADQREMHRVQTVEQVEQYWDDFLFRNVKPARHFRDPADEVTPYINDSRWVADCKACGNGMACWDQNPRACCLSCGTEHWVKWHPPEERAAAIRVIADWPQHNRNWDAHKGETVEQLKIQAILMTGVAPAERNGLLVGAGVTMPKEFTDPSDYLDWLTTMQHKGLPMDRDFPKPASTPESTKRGKK